MDWQRNLLLAAMAAVVLMLIMEWSDFQERHQPAVSAQAEQTTLSSTPAAAIPTVDTQASSDIPVSPDNPVAPVQVQASQALIAVITDRFNIYIDPLGGDIVKVALTQHNETLNSTDRPFILLNRTEQSTYIAQSGLIGQDGTDTAAGRPLFSSAQSSYQMNDSEDSLQVDLTLQQGSVNVIKRFTFNRADYLVKVEYLIDNQSSQAWAANFYAQIKRDSYNPDQAGAMQMQPFLGAAITTDENNYSKYDFDDIAESSIKVNKTGGWVAMVQHYFLSAWIPAADTDNTFSLRKGKGDIYLFGFTTPKLEVAAGQQGSVAADFYAGPKDIYRLEEVSDYLDLTVDYGWLWWIAKPLFYVLHWLHGIIGNWGLAIIALTVLIKAAFFQLSATSYKSMARMRKIQPMMADLKDRFGDDRQKMSTELMKLYKKEKVNPLGGCLPILVQMPVFIALYWVLMESVELRHTPFMGWIDDLSVKDPFFILPLIMGVTMFIQQKLNPTPPDPMQARIMQMMPIVFTFLFMWFPAGLVLYWVVNNALSISQQYVITKRIEASDAKTA